MRTIKININSKVNDRQTTTTFYHSVARYFLYAWLSLPQNQYKGRAHDWLILDVKNSSYRDNKELVRVFQAAINDMLAYYDEVYKAQGKGVTHWNKQTIYEHMLYIISFPNENTPELSQPVLKSEQFYS